MSTARPEIVGPEQWRAARDALLEKEKGHTRARDALAAERRRMPMIRVENGRRDCDRRLRPGDRRQPAP